MDMQAQLDALTARVAALEEQAKPAHVPVPSEWAVLGIGINVVHARTRARIREVLAEGPTKRRALSRRLSGPQTHHMDAVLTGLMREGEVQVDGSTFSLTSQ